MVFGSRIHILGRTKFVCVERTSPGMRNACEKWRSGIGRGGGFRLFTRRQTRRAALVCAQTGHIKGYLYIMCYRALAVAKAVSFITRSPAFLKSVSDARIRDDSRPSVRPSAMNPTLFAVFFAQCMGPEDRKEIGN